jgi:hypothetical protein
MRLSMFALACAALGGCGNSGPPPNPSALVGYYNPISIESSGVVDMDAMNVILGSGTDVLLTFRDGIKPQNGVGIRCGVMGSTTLDLVRQKMIVKHSTGEASGTGYGMGTISAAGDVDIMLTLETPGVGPPDAGSGGAPVSYHITGSRSK